MRIPRPLLALLTALFVLLPLAPQHAAADVDLYTTDGVHQVNGRQWRTHCEPYSATKRCWTDIWATTITYSDGHYTSTTGWKFNNLTYAASPRSLWTKNPLAAAGVVHGSTTWTGQDGRPWRTECDTPATGGNGCRTYTLSTVIEAHDDGGTTAYRHVTKWVFNNLVRFTPAPPKKGDQLDLIVDPALRGCVAEAVVGYGSVEAIQELWCGSRGIRTLAGLPALPRLVHLGLEGNRITDAAPLAALTGLTYLNLEGNQLTSVKGLTRLPALAFLYLHGNQLRSVDGLQGLGALEELFLEGNPVGDLPLLAPLVTRGCTVDIWP